MKKFLAFVMAVAMLLSCVVVGTPAADVWDGTAATEFAGGSGTDTDPYVIKTGAQLKYLSNQVAGGESYVGKYFVLGDDINLNNQEWAPIGGSACDFAGNFDGKGYTVSGIKISNTTTYKFGGLFGIVRGGSYFKNLVIANSAIDNSNVSGSYAGAAAGYIDVDMISSIVVKDSVSVSSADSTGGVFGRIVGGTATYIVNYATVTVPLTANNTFAGGIAGTLSGGGIISYSVNYGSVTGAGLDKNYYGGIVGLIGVNNNTSGGTATEGGSIENCYNDGDISGTETKPFVGGIVGRISDNSAATSWVYQIENAYNLGDLNCPNVIAAAAGETASRVGEITAQVHRGSVTLTNCYSVDVAKVALVKHTRSSDDLSKVANKSEAEIKALDGYKAINQVLADNLAVATYTVTFNANGGTVTPASMTTGTDGKLTSLPTPTRDNYDFDGWYIGTEKVTASKIYTAHTTVTAQWKEKTPAAQTYTVTFDTDGGSAVAAQSNIASGQTATKPADPTKEDYRFLGWYAPAATEPYDFATAVTSNLTLTARWVKTYTVTFIVDGGEYDKQTIDENGVVTAPAINPSKADYTFKGWNNGTTAYDFAIPVTGDLTLTAQWKQTAVQPTVYTVEFDSAGGSAVASQNITSGECAAKPIDPTRDGYIFKGWKNGNAAYVFTTPVTTDLTLTAQWEAIPAAPSLYAGGSGTAVDPFVIKTAAQLAKLSEQVAGGESYAGKYFILGNDIDLNDQEWTPIGISGSMAFKGSFDGKGYTVSGIKVNSTQTFGGLFGYVICDGYFKNLVIADSNISSAKYAGAVAAYIQAANISSITVKDDVSVVR